MRQIIFFCLLPFLVAGCVAPTKQAATPADNALASGAHEYLAAGNYTAAAEEYIRLAEKDKKNADSLLVQAASAYLAGNNPELANSTLSRVKVGNLTAVQAAERKILYARIALQQNNAAAAMQWLDFTLPPDVSRTLSASYYLARGLAQEMGGQLYNAVRSRVQLAGYLDADAEIHDNNHSIWNLLSQFSVSDLQKNLTGTEGELSGWLELAIIADTLGHDQTALDAAIGAWKQRYGLHPAVTQIIPEIYALTAETIVQSRHIALLLPFAAQYHDAAVAIRDGFLAAWYDAPSGTDKPVVKIYNTSNQDIMSIYNRAVADGADFMVGPLEKEAVTTLLASSNLQVKMLALNQVTPAHEQQTDTVTLRMPSIFQFGLLPEDDTYQAAERAWFNGLANALIITPDTSWGDRIYNAFSAHWLQLGGKIVEHVKISSDTDDLASPVKQLLNIDNSEVRAKELAALLGKNIHSEPRHRQDADLIFMATSPLVARQLIPQFRFFGVDNMAIYSIAGVYSGIHNIEADNDINGIVFADMPWIVDPGYENLPLQQVLNKNSDQKNSQYQRLYAFGIDAYRVLPKLAELFLQKNGKFNGVTGTLSVTKEGYVQRASTWVQVVKGLPQLLDKEQTTE